MTFEEEKNDIRGHHEPDDRPAMSESDKSGKPELTAEDKERIDAWIKPRILTLTHCATDWEFAQEAAEYATLHERSAAQARIAELEVACNLVITKVSAVSHPVHGAGDFILDDIVKILNKALRP